MDLPFIFFNFFKTSEIDKNSATSSLDDSSKTGVFCFFSYLTMKWNPRQEIPHQVEAVIHREHQVITAAKAEEEVEIIHLYIHFTYGRQAA